MNPLPRALTNRKVLIALAVYLGSLVALIAVAIVGYSYASEYVRTGVEEHIVPAGSQAASPVEVYDSDRIQCVWFGAGRVKAVAWYADRVLLTRQRHIKVDGIPEDKSVTCAATKGKRAAAGTGHSKPIIKLGERPRTDRMYRWAYQNLGKPILLMIGILAAPIVLPIAFAVAVGGLRELAGSASSTVASSGARPESRRPRSEPCKRCSGKGWYLDYSELDRRNYSKYHLSERDYPNWAKKDCELRSDPTLKH